MKVLKSIIIIFAGINFGVCIGNFFLGNIPVGIMAAVAVILLFLTKLIVDKEIK
jgi:hypothetical protein